MARKKSRASEKATASEVSAESVEAREVATDEVSSSPSPEAPLSTAEAQEAPSSQPPTSPVVGTVRVRNLSQAMCNGVAPGAVATLRADHPALHPLAREFEIVEAG